MEESFVTQTVSALVSVSAVMVSEGNKRFEKDICMHTCFIFDASILQSGSFTDVASIVTLAACICHLTIVVCAPTISTRNHMADKLGHANQQTLIASNLSSHGTRRSALTVAGWIDLRADIPLSNKKEA